MMHQRILHQIWQWMWGVLMVLGLWLSGNAAIALPLTSHALIPQASVLAVEGAEQAIASPEDSARETFRQAYERRYTWDADFPGYQAEVSVRYQGQMYHGLVQVRPDLSVNVLNLKNNNEVQQLVAGQLQMEITHRRFASFEERHGLDTFQPQGKDADGALEIIEIGPYTNSLYKVKDNQIVQVNRIMGPVAITATTLGTIHPPEGYLTSHFQMLIRDTSTGEVIEQDDVRDAYDKVGKYYVLSDREIRYGDEQQIKQKPIADVWMHFDSIQPLPPTA